MAKVMWYAVDEDDSKWLFPKKPTRVIDEWNSNEDLYWEKDIPNIIELTNQDAIELGLPDLTWENDPIEVHLVCTNSKAPGDK